MANKDKENGELRRQVQILEDILKQHGIARVVVVKNKEKDISATESITSDTQTESESVSSLTNADEDDKEDKETPTKTASPCTAAAVPLEDDEEGDVEVLRKIATIYNSNDDEDNEDDDDATMATMKTSMTASTMYTRRSLIMPPPEAQPPQPDPHPQGTQPGGRWFKQSFKGDHVTRPWTNRFTCTCSANDVDPQDECFVYYDRKGTRKYFSPAGKQVNSPVHKQGSVLKVVPNDGTMLAYFIKMGLPLYHQKQHTKKKRVLRSSIRSSGQSMARSRPSDGSVVTYEI